MTRPCPLPAARVLRPGPGQVRRISGTMRAVQIRQPLEGRPKASDLIIQDKVPIPTLKAPEDVLVRVYATAVNRADTVQRRGLYPPPPGAPDILGLEAAGVVCEVGPGVRSLRVGDRVMALLPGGGNAEYCVADERCCLPVPTGLGWAEAAAIPEVFITAFQCLFVHANLQPGQSVLIHAGASSVGLAAIQLCRAAGARHVITTSSPAKRQVCLDFGATAALSRLPTGPHAPIFAADVQDIVGPRGVDIILDPVFGNYLSEDATVLAVDGTIVVIAMMGGAAVDPPINMATLFRKRACLKFSTLRSTSAAYKADLVQRFWAFAAPRFRRGELRPVVHRTLPWTEVAAAHDLLDTNQTQGKVVLLVK